MNKYAPKPDSLKAKAIELEKSGLSPGRISQILHITRDTAYCWLRPKYRERSLKRREHNRALERSERYTVARDRTPELPVLPYVPHIILTKESRYQMVRSA